MGTRRTAGKSRSRIWRRGHLVMGLGASLLLIVTVVTGLLLLFPDVLGREPVRVTALLALPSAPDGGQQTLLRGTTEGLERSTDGGTTWREVPMLLPPGPVRSLALHPERPEVVAVLGRDGAALSRDGGRIWEPLDPGELPGSLWLDRVDLAFGPGGNLDLATAGGFWRSGDLGATWAVHLWTATPAGNGLRRTVHDLHTGYYWGRGGAWVVAGGGAALLLLTLSGLYLGLRRSREKGGSGLRRTTLAWTAGLLVWLTVQPALGSPASCLESVEQGRLIMGTVATAAAWAPDRASAEAAVAGALAEMERIETLLSTWRPDSEISRLNSRLGPGPHPVSDDLAAVLAAALDLARRSGGAFDPTVLPLVEVWGFRGPDQVGVPADSLVAAALSRVGHDRVRFDPQQRQVWFAGAGLKLDFGGAAKGHALDRAAEVMRELGAVAGRLDLGGEILVFGDAAATGVGIVDPRGGENSLGAVQLADAAVATSGQYERYREDGDRRWGHILDPRTGRPVDHLLSVTVVARTALLADAAATACFVLGKEKGLALLESLPHCEGIVVHPGTDEEPQVSFTSGLR
jgi:thiamine biosynthesis lipoprotein